MERLDDYYEYIINSKWIKEQRELVQFIEFSKYENMP